MPEKTIDHGRLEIKCFHINDVDFGEKNEVESKGKLRVCKDMLSKLAEEKSEFIDHIDLQVIQPDDHDRYTNTIMDFIPISTKVLGAIGTGVTYTLTGVYFMLTGVDTEGIQAHEFGSSEGNLKDQVIFNRPSTPKDGDVIISFDVTLKAGMAEERKGCYAAHEVCDLFIQEFRNQMKHFNANDCTEKHVYHDIERPGRKKIVIIRQVAGQGAMYDMYLFPDEPSGAIGGKSIIDMGNMPVVVTPNEYRDGILRSMQ